VKKFLIILLFYSPVAALAQVAFIKGVVREHSGDKLPLANILILPDSLTVSTDHEGFFSARIATGDKNFIVSYTGFQTLEFRARVRHDTTLSFSLSQRIGELKEVTITADRFSNQDIVQSTRSGTNTVTQKDIYSIPVLGGEADLIKTLQLLPGTVRGVEGSSDLFVRGGAADQNLVLLDGAPIYNTSHLFGFLSVFNPDMLQQVEAMNGAFPAEYGGRLSSILDIKSKSFIPERTYVSGDIGLIASRLYIEQPILKNKASVWVAARRTYIDQVVKAIGEELPYFFYDLNGKLILQPTPADRIELSHYSGEDILDIFRDRNNDGNGFLTSYTSGNSSQSLQWNHRFRNKWESNLSLIRTWYQYRIRNAFEENELAAFSDIEDYGAKLTFKKQFGWRSSEVKAGLEWIRHGISPNVINSQGTISELLASSSSQGKIAQEVAAHVQQEWSLTDRWRINAGLRASMGIVSNEQYFFPEPRVSARYAIGKDHALKFSYSRMAQYMHRISNSAVSTPTDIWYPVTDSIRPQSAHQVSAAWQRFLPGKKIYFSAEGYYKSMSSLIGYEEGTNLFFNTDFESKLIQGDGKAYGFEFLVKKESGKFTGWVSYTLSWSWRRYDEINNGDWFHARYDRRHNGAIVMQYMLGKRWAASLVWEFISGARFTPVIGQYTVLAPTLTGFDLIPVYSNINDVKLADSHRLDFGIKYMNKPERKFRWQVFAGVYNAYNRASPIGIIIEQDEVDGSLNYSQPGLFGLLPFISYGFRF
jgi:outer membrane receptor protein involved in Fe transport